MSPDEERPDDTEPAARRHWATWLTFGVILILAVVLLVLYLIPANEYALAPGDAVAVEPLISIKGHPLKNTSGRLFLTDVTFYKVDRLLEDLYFRCCRSGTDLQPAAAFSGGLSESQYIQLSALDMQDSIQQAEAAALTKVAGYRPTFATTGPKIVQVIPRVPASHVLHVGDVIEYVDGHRIHRADQVRRFAGGTPPGGTVLLEVLRDGKRRKLPVRTIAIPRDVQHSPTQKSLIGISVEDQLRFPLKISIQPGDIVGPSAGLMFSLGIVQRLQPGDITRGCPVAGTGTIQADGSVGEIGGVKQKIIGARNAGAKVFFVPNVPDNLLPALQNRGEVRVVPVKKLGDALRFLRTMQPCK